ncbi:Pr5-like receptor kinase, partial [Thalictrum thalictroides]
VSPRASPSNQSVGISPPNQSVRISPSFQPTLKSNHRQRGLSIGVKVLIGVIAGVGVLLLLVLLLYRKILFSLYKVFNTHWRNNSISSTNVETFLESCGNLALQRYKYSDIKKMTNSFKETLGKGGYACVFKGKLKHDGRLVAVKLLNESKGNGDEFINEVATIGRTNHVNVVSLLGFCTEGTKRALVYEFMPNGSLERFIFNEKTSSTPLGWEKLYQIALGIARGLEYLHRGCNTRILHFDIKPHNILLDEEFVPKISDFGLAKLCPTRESVVSMLVARGTIGYIAPEVICRNFGGVSHKSDVYSYGMMVLEIIGGRKNIDATVENISEIYFPQWIYNHLKQDINIEGTREIYEDETTKKMIIVALWCIQTQPTDRPSISKVVEMLEGNTEDLQMPPNPFPDPPSRSSP